MRSDGELLVVRSRPSYGVALTFVKPGWTAIVWTPGDTKAAAAAARTRLGGAPGSAPETGSTVVASNTTLVQTGYEEPGAAAPHACAC